MANGDGAAKFYTDSVKTLVVGLWITYVILIIDTTICIGYLLCTQGCRNYTLLLLLANTFVYAGVFVAVYSS